MECDINCIQQPTTRNSKNTYLTRQMITLTQKHKTFIQGKK